jgi:hypothetical protein
MANKTTNINREEFKKWLIAKHGLSREVAKDNASRAKRVARWVSFDLKQTEAGVVDLMKERSGGVLNSVIYSQLKRAVRLYREFTK